MASAQLTQRVSLTSTGTEANGASGGYISGETGHSISPDGRFIAFESEATNLVPGDTNNARDVFVRDRQLGTTERVSVDSTGAQAADTCSFPSITADGRYVAFWSSASNLVPGDTNGFPDVFLRDRQSSTTERMSVDSTGVQGNSASAYVSISADGRRVAFASWASNLVAGDTNGRQDVFVHDRLLGITERVSVASNGTQGNWESYNPSISADGLYVAFESYASNLVPGDSNTTFDVLLRDLQGGTTELVSLSSAGVQGVSGSNSPSTSPDGRFVAFESNANNLVSGDFNGHQDIFVRDRQSGTTELVSVNSAGVQGNLLSYDPVLSADGRFIAFHSSSSNLVAGDLNGSIIDVFVRDRQSNSTECVSLSWVGVTAGGRRSSITADGRFVSFESPAYNLVPGDIWGQEDVFVRDRIGGPTFTSLCDPGVGGVLVCPCSNPPAGQGAGCDNSSSTGGAILSASGGTYLSSDSLTFTTSGERPTALSILAQWISGSNGGLVFGQGVRCTSGTFKRLFNKTAAGGSITVPNFQLGDPTISARSAAKGDTILAGQSRWYLVYYRDGVVLGGCPSTSTFNSTQTGQVTWSP